MKLQDLQISQETFFKVGVGSFAIIALANAATLFYTWANIPMSARVSSLVGIIFNIAMVLFFNYLLNMARPQITEEYAGDDVKEIIGRIKKDHEQARTKKNTKKKKSKA